MVNAIDDVRVEEWMITKAVFQQLLWRGFHGFWLSFIDSKFNNESMDVVNIAYDENGSIHSRMANPSNYTRQKS